MPNYIPDNDPFLYVSNMDLVYATTTTLTVTAGMCRDQSNIYDIVVPVNTTISFNNYGFNAIDQGTITASSLYTIYAIADGREFNPPGFVASLSNTIPFLPAGYSVYRRIGQVAVGSGSTILDFYQFGTGTDRTYQYDIPITALSAGSSATFASFHMEKFVPSIINTPVIMTAEYTPATAGNICYLRPTGSTQTTTVPFASGVVISVAQYLPPTTMLCGLNTNGQPSFDYEVQTSDALTVRVIGYRDAL